MNKQTVKICPLCKKNQVTGRTLAKDGRTYICQSCKENGH